MWREAEGPWREKEESKGKADQDPQQWKNLLSIHQKTSGNHQDDAGLRSEWDGSGCQCGQACQPAGP